MGKKPRGIFQDPSGTAAAHLEDKVADYSYSSDALAQLIVDMWSGFHGDLLKDPQLPITDSARLTQNALADRGIYLEKPIVITEAEYEKGFKLADAGLSALLQIMNT